MTGSYVGWNRVLAKIILRKRDEPTDGAFVLYKDARSHLKCDDVFLSRERCDDRYGVIMMMYRYTSRF